MPVALKCTSCGHEIQSDADDATPSSCPACGAAVVPAAAEKKVFKLTAADVLSSAKPSLPALQSFAELAIPEKFKKVVEAELTRDEKLLWLGRPSRNPDVLQVNPHLRLPIAAVMYLIVVGIWIGLLALSPTPVGFTSVGKLVVTGFALLFTGLLAFIATLMVLGPRLGNTWINTCMECYAVTNRRAIRVAVLFPFLVPPRAKSYLPQQLLAIERKDHPRVTGAGDLIFEYEFRLNSPGGSNTPGSPTPVRVPIGFSKLDQVCEVEHLIRTTLLANLETKMDSEDEIQALPTPPPIGARPAWDQVTGSEGGKPIAVACNCGAELEAPGDLAGAMVKCPQCAVSVSIPAPPKQKPGDYVEHGQVPAELKEKILAELGPTEKVVWFGAPNPTVVLIRSSGWLAAGLVLFLGGLIWLVIALTPSAPAAPPPAPLVAPGKRAPAPPPPPPAPSRSLGHLLPPFIMLLVGGVFSIIPVVRWYNATHTCYALTNRRALVRRKGLFTPAEESYSPAEVTGMRRRDSWTVAGSGDVIFRSVTVITTSYGGRGGSSSSSRTTHYGFLAIPRVQEVEKMVREKLIDRFVDRLTEANRF